MPTDGTSPPPPRPAHSSVWTPPAPGAHALRIPDPPHATGPDSPNSPHARTDVLTRVVTARPPGSKSLTNRAVLLAALAEGTSTLHDPLLDADDAKVMRDAIAALGAKPTIRGNDLIIEGVAGRWSAPHSSHHTTTLTLSNAGTAVRFLAAAAWLARAPVTIDGSKRMRQRPIAELADLLRALDCTITYHAADGFPPLTIHPPASGPAGCRTLDVGPTQSGQFISALLLAAAFVPGGLTLRANQGLTSASYIEMTLALLAKLGAQVQSSLGMRVIRVAPPLDRAGIAPFNLDIEPDASGATYLWAAAMLRPGLTVLVPGLRPSHDLDDHAPAATSPTSEHLARSLQGDANFVLLLQRMGATVQVSDAGTSVAAPHDAVIHAIEADMADMPDAAMTLAVLASRANAPTLLRGVRTLRVKETDRIAALTTELAKVGTRIDSPFKGDPDALLITPGHDHNNPVEFHTYDDHRMAMALSLLGLVRPGVTILDPWCVAKTYPSFWTHFASLANFTAPH